MIRKTLLIIMLTLLAFILPVYGAIGEDTNHGEPLFYIEETGEAIYSYYQYKEPETGEMIKYYPFRITSGLKEVLKILDYSIYMEEGQLILLPVDNGGDINNLEVLKNPANLNKLFKIHKNAYNHTGSSYPQEKGRPYPTVYPSIPEIDSSLWGKINWNLKDTTENKLGVIDAVADPNKLFFKNDSGVALNPRIVMDRHGNYQTFIFFPTDVGTGVFFPPNTVIYQPWTLNKFGINEGYFNKAFNAEFRTTGKIDKKWIEYYAIFSAENHGLDSVMGNKAMEKGLANTLENRTRMFFEGYYSVTDVPTRITNAYAQEIHYNGQYYSNMFTGIISNLDNLRVASEEKPIGKYKLQIVDVETNKVLDSEKDTLKSGQVIRMIAYLGYESTEDKPTFNNNIRLNYSILYNNNTDLSHADEYYPLIQSNKGSGKLYRASNGFSLSKDFVPENHQNIAIFTKELVVPENNNSLVLDKISFYASLPYQYNFYTSTNISENDNQKLDDDIAKITFNVENKNKRDLAVSFMELTDLSGNPVSTVIKGEKYKLTFKCKNIGEEQTQTAVNSGLYTNNILGQYYNAERTLGNNVSGQNIYLQKGQEATFTQEITIPLNTTESKLILHSFIPMKYDNVGDNIFYDKDDVKFLELPIKSATGANAENLAIVDIRLFNNRGVEYNKKQSDGSYDYDLILGQSFYIEVEVIKTIGSTLLERPEILLEVRDSQDQVQKFTLKTAGKFKNKGDVIIFKSSNFNMNDGLIDVFAMIPEKYKGMGLNDDSSDDVMTKTWRKMLNARVDDFTFTTSTMEAGKNENNPVRDLGFKTVVSLDITDKSFNLNAFLATVHNSNNQLVFTQKDIIFTPSRVIIEYYGVVPNQKLKIGNNVYTFTINGDRGIYEFDGSSDPYKDNRKTANVYVKKKTEPEKERLVCSAYNKQNNWSTTFDIRHNIGHMETYTVTTKTGTTTRTRCVVDTTNEWQEVRSFTETFKVEAINFKSPSTIDKFEDNYINILNNSKNAIVRAGQWYELEIQTRYNTNRKSGAPSKPSGLCSSSVTPGTSNVYSSDLIQLKMQGYGEEKTYYLNPYKASGSWDNVSRFFRIPLTSGIDAMGQTTNRIYLPVTAQNGQINISIITDPFNGYIYDNDHPRNQLQDCISTVINIQNQVNVRSSIIGND